MSAVICIGEMLIDFIGSRQDTRLARQESFMMKSGGAPANVSCVIGSLGGRCYFYGSVGQDGFGDFLEMTLKQYGVRTKWLKRSDKPTTLAFVSVDADGERDFVFYRGADADVKMDGMGLLVDQEIKLYHFGAATGFLKGSLKTTYRKLLHLANEKGCFITFDPNYRPAFWEQDLYLFRLACDEFLQLADLVKLSEEEAFLISEKVNTAEMVDYFRNNYKATFAVTLGSKGALIFNGSWEMTVPAPKVNVVDTTGAGDAFIGALLNELSNVANPQNAIQSQSEMLQYVKKANEVASEICTALGALTALRKINEIE